MNKYEKMIITEIEDTVPEKENKTIVLGYFLRNFEIKTTGKYLKINKLLGNRTNFSLKLSEFLISNGMSFKLDYNDAEVYYSVERQQLKNDPNLENELISLVVEEIP